MESGQRERKKRKMSKYRKFVQQIEIEIEDWKWKTLILIYVKGYPLTFFFFFKGKFYEIFILEIDYLHTLLLVHLNLLVYLLLKKTGLKMQYYTFESLYPNILHSWKAEIRFQKQTLDALCKQLLCLHNYFFRENTFCGCCSNPF